MEKKKIGPLLIIISSMLCRACGKVFTEHSKIAGEAWQGCHFVGKIPENLRIEHLWWFHIPKTGRDFVRSIASAAGISSTSAQLSKEEESVMHGPPFPGHQGLPANGKHPCLRIPWNASSAADDTEPFQICSRGAVGFFRQPSQRLISSYFHSKVLPFFDRTAIQAHAQAQAEGLGLGARLEAMLNASGPCIYGFQTKMLLGVDARWAKSDCRVLDAAAVAHAVLNLESSFSFVGITEHCKRTEENPFPSHPSHVCPNSIPNMYRTPSTGCVLKNEQLNARVSIALPLPRFDGR